jgi:hypothetical protein
VVSGRPLHRLHRWTSEKHGENLIHQVAGGTHAGGGVNHLLRNEGSSTVIGPAAGCSTGLVLYSSWKFAFGRLYCVGDRWAVCRGIKTLSRALSKPLDHTECRNSPRLVCTCQEGTFAMIPWAEFRVVAQCACLRRWVAQCNVSYTEWAICNIKGSATLPIPLLQRPRG